MITEKEKVALKEIIGERHIAQICAYLNEKEIFNRFGQPYTSIFISRVFNGGVKNKFIEQHIWDFAEKRKKEDEEEEQRRKAILEN